MGPVLKRRPSAAEIEKICLAAEEAVENYLESTEGLKSFNDISIVVRAEGSRPLRLIVDVNFDAFLEGPDSDVMLKEATASAFKAAEEKAKELRLWKSSRKSKD